MGEIWGGQAMIDGGENAPLPLWWTLKHDPHWRHMPGNTEADIERDAGLNAWLEEEERRSRND